MKKIILVVDDVPERISDIEQEVTFSFPHAAIEVRGVNTIREAVRAFEESGGGFDLVLLDLKLPAEPTIPDIDADKGGLYLLCRYAAEFPSTIFVLSSGSHSPNELPEIVLPSNFPEKNFYCVPKTAARSELLKILIVLVEPVATPF